MLTKKRLAKSKLSDRKLRLFGCACARQIWDFFKDERSKEAVRIAERFADGKSSEKELAQAHISAWAVWSDARVTNIDASQAVTVWAAANALATAANVTAANALTAANNAVRTSAWTVWAGTDNVNLSKKQEYLLAEFINKSYPKFFQDYIVNLAKVAYESDGVLDKTQLAILADALEDQGEQKLVSSLREDKDRYKGYWVLDLILGFS